MNREPIHGGRVGSGVFFVVAGVLFLLNQLGAVSLRPAFLWPTLLIGLGAAVLVGGMMERGDRP